LNSVIPQLTVDQVMQAITHHFCIWQKASKKRRIKLIKKIKHKFGLFQAQDVCHINYDEQLMGGIEKIRSELSDWEWIFGKTPKFTLKHRKIADVPYECNVTIKSGRIAQISIVRDSAELPMSADQLPNLLNLPLIESNVQIALDSWFSSNPSVEALFLKQMIHETLQSAFF
jgi:hypothetical protein